MYDQTDAFGLADEDIRFRDDSAAPADPTRRPHVMTVLGPVAPDELGVTLPHEHLLAAPPARIVAEPDLRIDDRHAALADAETFSWAGGGTIVDCTPPDNGRDLEGLRWVAEHVAVRIVAVSGFHMALHNAGELTGRSAGDVARELITELTEGAGLDRIRPGLLKAASSLNQIHDTERTAFEAVAIAHRATGVPITTHTEAGMMAREQVALLREFGVDPRRIIIGHMDRRWDDRSLLVSVLKTGATIGFDQLGKPKYGPDAEKARVIRELVDAGYGEQLLLSHDLARRSLRPAYGGQPGFAWLLDRFALMLLDAGLTAMDVRQLLVDNPARALTIHPPARPNPNELISGTYRSIDDPADA